jgi:hypothetical protein
MNGHGREAQRGTGGTHVFRQSTAMRVGVNYPWKDYGWDFGVSPFRPQPQGPRWLAQIDADLRRFKTLRVSAVRWFILGDGFTYGTPQDQLSYITTPTEDPLRYVNGTNIRQWRFNPPNPGTFSLQVIVDEVHALLDRFRNAYRTVSPAGQRRIKLLPVLTDHLMFFPSQPVSTPSGFVKQGRSDVVSDRSKRDLFVRGLVQPLLSMMGSFRDFIEAVEVVNEPEWCVQEFPGGNAANKTIRRSEMIEFLQRIAGEITSAGFRPTVGFIDPGSLSWGVSGLLPQVHYYGHRPDRNAAAPLPPPTGTDACLGEFGTRDASHCTTYPCDPSWAVTSVLDRLHRCAGAGYASAFVWSKYGGGEFVWDSGVEDDIYTFNVGGRVRRSAP